MKTSLDHLPPHKREQLAAVLGLLREAAPVEMVILFGSHARGDWVEDPVSSRRTHAEITRAGHTLSTFPGH